MKCSVIIPAYNATRTLETTVESVLKCGLPDLEIILVDDGSTDDTPDVCDRLADSNPEVRCFHQSNKGVSVARNRGIEVADGDYIWFFDSDDLVDSGSMQLMTQILDEREPDVLMFGMSFDYYCCKHMYERLELYYDAKTELTADDIQAAFIDLYHDNMLSSSCNKLIKRCILLEKEIFFNPTLFVYEDLFFSLQLFQHTSLICNVPKAIYRYKHQEERNWARFRHRDKRTEHIYDPAEYLKPFQPLLQNHPEILINLYFFLLNDKLSLKKPKEMHDVANCFLQSTYASDEFNKKYTPLQKWIAEKLNNREFRELYYHYKKSKIRNRLVRIIKGSLIYRLSGHPKTRKIHF